MAEPLQHLMGSGPYPVARSELTQALRFSTCSCMFVASSRRPLDFPGPTLHSHPGYEFALPQTPMPAGVIGTRTLGMELGMVYPINPEEPHGTTAPMTGIHLTAIQMDQDYLGNLARAIYGRRHIRFEQPGVPAGRGLLTPIELFVEEAENRQLGSDFVLESLATQIGVVLLRLFDHGLPEVPHDYAPVGRNDIRRAVDYLLNSGEDYSLEDVARVANLSPYHFIRVFRAETGRTPYEFLMQARVDRARSLLRATDLTVTEICYASGFKNLSHFTTVFKRLTQMSPTAYRKRP